MSKEHAILSKLFAGFDGGYFTLPKELIERRTAERRVDEALVSLNTEMRAVSPGKVLAEIAERVIVAASKAAVPPDSGKALVEEQETLRRLSADQAVLTAARDSLRDGPSSVPYLAMRRSDDIIAEHLRPAMDDVLDAVRSGANLAPAVPWTDTRALIRASEEVREYHELVAVSADRYSVIRDAQDRLRLLTGGPSLDAADMFSQLRNMHTIWPQRRSAVESIRGKAPWPADPLERMVWLVTSEAEPWMPTAVECEDAYDALVQANPLRLVTA